MSKIKWVVALLVLAGCGVDPLPKFSPATEAVPVLHSLGIRFSTGNAESVISGVWTLPGNSKKAFYYVGSMGAEKKVFQDPIYKDQVTVNCSDSTCKDLEFTLLLDKESKVQEKIKAHVFEIVSMDPHSDPAVDPGSTFDVRVYWQSLLKGNLDLAKSNWVEARSKTGLFVSALLVGVNNPTFQLHSPSEGGGGRIGYDYRSADGGNYGTGHAEGELTSGSNQAHARVIGGAVDLILR